LVNTLVGGLACGEIRVSNDFGPWLPLQYIP
jgi:hypothetical protein